jgi:DNA (cytosine-5)-methyltransferase 1
VKTLTVGSLFAGIGGFDLAAERAGLQVKWQVEIDDYATRVLEKHWPDVQRFRDVRLCGADNLEPVDVICGGFPCQDISSAGQKVGIDGERSGLWSEYARIVRELRPRYVVVENVAGLAARGLGRVLGDLAACGYDTEWESLPAGLFGAPHLRARIFVVGYTDRHGESDGAVDDETPWMPALVADAEHAFRKQRRALGRAWGSRESVPWDERGRCVDPALAVRVDDGFPGRLDRLRCLGNSVVPAAAEFIFGRILEAEQA